MPRESLQKKVGRVRPPRVHITYDVQLGDVIELRELAFVVGVLADLSGVPAYPRPPLSERRFHTIDRDNFDEVIQNVAPRVTFTVRNVLNNNCGSFPVELRIACMADFEPASAARQIPELRSLLEIRTRLADLRSSVIGNYRLENQLLELIKQPELINRIRVEERNESFRTFVDGIKRGEIARGDDVEVTIGRRIAALDAMLSRQLDEVMHAKSLQDLEATWRGVQYLVRQSETSSNLKIKVLDVSRDDLFSDLNQEAEPDHTAMFAKIERECTDAGGSPFGVLVGAYEFGRHPDEVRALQKMAQMAAECHAPFIAAASPAMFNVRRFTEFAGPRDLAKLFEDGTYSQWNAFRSSEYSRYVGLCLPRVLMRLPYGSDTVPVEEFDYEEAAIVAEHSGYLFGNAAFVFAARLTDAFARYCWCAAIRGVEGGGLVEGLPTHTFSTDDLEVAVNCPTEIAITDRRESELARLGFIPLCYYKGTSTAVFMEAPSVQKPQPYLDEEANANARLSTELQYIFPCCRFAQFLKRFALENAETVLSSREQCERLLQEWILHYVLADDLASAEMRAKFPLRDARVSVSPVLSDRAPYVAIVFLRPHFQLDEMAVSLRLVVTLGATGAGAATPPCGGMTPQAAF